MADAEHSVQTRGKRLSFDRYVLDLDRGCLLLDGSEIALRPKTFSVLQYLVENRGRLLSKDDIFAAVWPNLSVTDDTLVQSIVELRRALGSDGPRLVKTIPRRGYRFESASTAAGSPPPTDALAPATLPADRQKRGSDVLRLARSALTRVVAEGRRNMAVSGVVM